MKSSHTLKRMTSILLAFSLLVQFCVLIAFASGSNGLDGSAISGVSLEKMEPDGTYTDVTGQTISPVDSLRLTYNVRFSQDKLDEIQGKIVSDGGYAMEIPPVTGLVYAQSTYVITTNGYKFAELSVGATGSAFLSFTGDFWYVAPTSGTGTGTSTDGSLNAPYITGYNGANVSLALDCSLNMIEIGLATDYTIIAGGVAFPIKVASLMLMTVTISKSLDEIAESGSIVKKLFKKNGDQWTQITGTGTEVSNKEDLRLTYDFNILAAQLIEIYNNSGVVYEIDVPILNNLTGVSTSADIPVYVDGISAENKDMKLASLKIDNNRAYLVFDGDFWDYIGKIYNNGRLIDGNDELLEIAVELYITCKLNNSILSEKCTIDLGTDSVTVTITENKPDPLVKSGVYDASTRRITWTVTYNPSVGAVLPVVFEDTFTNTYHSFVQGSLKLKIGDDDTYSTLTSIDDYAVVDLGTTTTITLSADDETFFDGKASPTSLSAPWVFTYQTELTDAYHEAYSSSTIKLTNSATVNNHSDTFDVTLNKGILSTYKYAVTTPGGGSTTATISGNEIYWRITVNVGAEYQNSGPLTVTDIIPDGLSLDASSVKIGSAPPTSSTVTTLTDNTTKLEVEIPEDGDAPNKYKSTYYIYFTTTIDESYFIQNAANGYIDEKFTNSLTLTFDGGKTLPATRTVTVDTNIIQKSGVYDAATHKIKWEVRVNPHKVDLKNVIITDVIEDDQTYDETSFKPDESINLTGNQVLVADYNEASRTLTVTINDLGTETAVFTFETYVNDPTDYAYNTNANPYSNTAKIIASVSSLNNGDKPVADKATATPDVISTVLKKEAGDAVYDYQNHIATWKITVNQNNMPMTNVRLVDEIPAFQSFVQGSVRIDGTPAAQGNVSCNPNVISGGETLTITLGNVNSQKVITYQTNVDVNADTRFNDQADVVITNSVTIKRDTYNDETDSGSQTIKNTVLSKSFKMLDDDRKIEFSVNINPNNMDLTDYELKDELPAGLVLDNQTVMLYEASVAAGTAAFMKGSPVDDFVWTYNPPKSSTDGSIFTVKLPEAKSYILIYQCYIASDQNKSYSNNVRFTGMSSSVKSTATVEVKNGGKAKAYYNRYMCSLEITKRDRQTHEALKGVEFKLFTTGGGLVGVGTTDDYGMLTFTGLSLGATYLLEETNGPSGYDISYKGNVTILDGVNAHVIENDRDNGFDFEFYKMDANSNSLAVRDAQFALYKYKDKSTRVDVDTSATSGRVYFSGLAFGQYTLVETDAPQDYYLSSNEYTVEIKSNGEYTIKIDSTGNELQKNGNGKYIIYNTPIPKQPNPPTNPPTNPPAPQSGGGGTTPPVVPLTEPEPEPVEELEPGEEPIPLPGEPEEAPGVIPPGEQEPIVTPQGTPAVPGEVVVPPRGITPHRDNGTFVLQDDGSIIEFDDEGVPLGRWTQDEDGVWIFDEDVPLGALSQTGVNMPIIWPLIVLGMWLIAAGAFLKKIRGY